RLRGRAHAARLGRRGDDPAHVAGRPGAPVHHLHGLFRLLVGSDGEEARAFRFRPDPQEAVRSRRSAPARAYPHDEVEPRPAALGVELDETLDAALKAGNPLVNRECKFSVAGASPGAARLWSEPFKLAGLPHLLIIIEDISAHAELEAQLRQRQKMESVGHL